MKEIQGGFSITERCRQQGKDRGGSLGKSSKLSREY
jgi:hypothetical protein